MKSEIVRSDSEIDEVLEWAAEGEDEGTKYPGMSYEQGVKAMYEWLIGNSDDRPDA